MLTKARMITEHHEAMLRLEIYPIPMHQHQNSVTSCSHSMRSSIARNYLWTPHKISFRVIGANSSFFCLVIRLELSWCLARQLSISIIVPYRVFVVIAVSVDVASNAGTVPKSKLTHSHSQNTKVEAVPFLFFASCRTLTSVSYPLFILIIWSLLFCFDSNASQLIVWRSFF